MAFEGALRCIPGLVASGDLSLDQFKFMVVKAGGASRSAAVAGIVDGVLQNKPNAAGEAATVAFSGVSKVVAGAAVGKGNHVATDGSGKAVTAISGDIISGTALTDASADGDIISVLLDTKNAVEP